MELLNYLNTGMIYVANGILFFVYFLAKAIPALLALASGIVMIITLDKEVQNRANFKPGRSGPMGNENINTNRRDITPQGSNSGTPRTAQILTVIVLALWLIAQTGMAAPVPWIGTVMWLVGTLVLFVMPSHQRMNMLWFVKTGLCVYALLVIGSWIYLGYTAQISSEQWASIIGSADSAATLIARTRGNTTTIITWALWLVAPLGFFSLLIQQLFVNPINLVSPLAGAQDVIAKIRQR
jgi:hypothetical protein